MKLSGQAILVLWAWTALLISAHQVSPQPHPSNARLASSFQPPAGDSLYLISAAIRIFTYQIRATLDLAAVTSAVPVSNFCLLLSLIAPNLNLDCQRFGAKLPSCVAWSSPLPSHSLCTPYVSVSVFTAQRDEGKKGPHSSGLIRFEIKGKTSTGINSAGSARKGLILKVLLSASWRVCISSTVRDFILQIKILKPTNHFNESRETPSATLVRKLPVMKERTLEIRGHQRVFYLSLYFLQKE